MVDGLKSLLKRALHSSNQTPLSSVMGCTERVNTVDVSERSFFTFDPPPRHSIYSLISSIFHLISVTAVTKWSRALGYNDALATLLVPRNKRRNMTLLFRTFLLTEASRIHVVQGREEVNRCDPGRDEGHHERRHRSELQCISLKSRRIVAILCETNGKKIRNYFHLSESDIIQRSESMFHFVLIIP
ncbi:hypothetical protein TNCV_5089721 [Trichonephila clavipes]|nr:hypothetical protein TNCV_5089721 [Trichonephila clavipes]